MLRRYEHEERQQAAAVQREEPAPSPVKAVLRLQRAAGNRAVARMLAPKRATVARAITIGNDRYTHGSRRVVELFDRVVMPELAKRGYKSWGIKARLVDFIRTNNATYAGDSAFLAALMPWLERQTRKVGDDKETSVLKKFSVQGMNRPAWPEELRKKKGWQKGDHLRHVVRNQTLKDALEIEWKRYEAEPERRDARFSDIGNALGLIGQASSLDALVKQIYGTLYLNEENLFAGEGYENQVIGLAADPVRKVGEKLIAMGEETAEVTQVIETVEITKEIEAVMHEVRVAADKIRAQVQAKTGSVPDVDERRIAFVVDQIRTTVEQAILSLRQYENDTEVPAEVAGELVSDIGLGFGFDLIEGRTPEDRDDIAERQHRLLWTERAIQAFKDSGGTKGDVLHIFLVFMGKAPVPTQAFEASGDSQGDDMDVATPAFVLDDQAALADVMDVAPTQ